MENGQAFLIQVTPTTDVVQRQIKSKEFRIGRNRKADMCMTDLSVSRNQCVISCDDTGWWLTNESRTGTIVADMTLGPNERCRLINGNIIQLGSVYRFKFRIASDTDDSPPKRAKIEPSLSLNKSDDKDNTRVKNKEVEEEGILKKQNDDLSCKLQKVIAEKEKVRLEYEEEKKRIENELTTEKIALEQKLKEMECLLSSKEMEQQTLTEKLRQTDEENMKLIALRQETVLKAETIIASLRSEVLQKELVMRETLEVEMKSLLDNRLLIEERIRVEKEQTEGVCAEKLRTLEEELYRVKQDLVNTRGKHSLLEREMEQSRKEGSREKLMAKHEALSELANLIEMELQCSICSELFVKATTLSCTHTVCHFCLQQWKQKQRNCPLCRAPIVTENHSIVLDSFIDKIVDNLSDEMKKRRQQIIEERKGGLFPTSRKAKKKFYRSHIQ